jgi:hypothetical protein
MNDSDGHQLINDIRYSSKVRLLDLLLIKWQSSNYSINDENRMYFAHQGMIVLGRDVIRILMDSGSTSIQQSTLVHLSTNSIQYYRKPQPDGTSLLLQLQCDQCNMIGTVPHLTNCPSSIGITYRNDLHHSIKTLLKTNSSVTGWT